MYNTISVANRWPLQCRRACMLAVISSKLCHSWWLWWVITSHPPPPPPPQSQLDEALYGCPCCTSECRTLWWWRYTAASPPPPHTTHPSLPTPTPTTRPPINWPECRRHAAVGHLSGVRLVEQVWQQQRHCRVKPKTLALTPRLLSW